MNFARKALVGALCIAGVLPQLLRADIVVTKSVIHTGDIVRVENLGGVTIHLAIGDIGVQRLDIVRVEAEKPAAFDVAVAALRSKKFAEAEAGLKPIADRYGGVPKGPAWMEDSLVRLAVAYLGQKKGAEAKQVLDRFKKFYPGGLGADVLDGHILYEQKEYAKAAELLNRFLDPLLKKESLGEDEEPSVAEALIVLGDCQLAQNQADVALDNYLRVVTLFNLDADRAAEAKLKSGQIFEQQQNWKRAKGAYEEVTIEAPSPAIKAEAKDKLASLAKAHPE